MFGGVLVAVILVIMAGAHIATTISTANELSKLRASIRGLELDLQNSNDLYAPLKERVSSKNSPREASREKPTDNSLSGELDIYHGGRLATVKAVFRPRHY